MPEEVVAAEVLGAGLTAGSGATIGGGALGAGLVASEAATAGGLASMGGGVGLTATAGAGSGFGVLGGAAAAGTAASIANTLKTAATVLAPTASIVSAAAGMDSAKRMSRMSGTAPTVTPPVTMPILGGFSTQQGIRGSLEQQAVRRGRAATIMTEPYAEKLGQ